VTKNDFLAQHTKKVGTKGLEKIEENESKSICREKDVSSSTTKTGCPIWAAENEQDKSLDGSVIDARILINPGKTQKGDEIGRLRNTLRVILPDKVDAETDSIVNEDLYSRRNVPIRFKGIEEAQKTLIEKKPRRNAEMSQIKTFSVTTLAVVLVPALSMHS
jgi:hypothetical protein